MERLDDIAAKHGTDKSSQPNKLGLKPKGYTFVYEQFLEPRRNDPLRLLEIGVRNGESIKTWEEYLPNTEIHGVDIHKTPQFGPKVTIHIGDQAEPSFLKTLTGPWDIIIDDGGHTWMQQQTSLYHLWKELGEEGIYFIEDLHTSRLSAQEAESRHADANKTTAQVLGKMTEELVTGIKPLPLLKELRFYESLAVLIKDSRATPTS